jgi:hypothetical protein
MLRSAQAHPGGCDGIAYELDPSGFESSLYFLEGPTAGRGEALRFLKALHCRPTHLREVSNFQRAVS